MGQVNITLANGQLGGAVQTEDGIVGLVLTGGTGDEYVLGTPILLTSSKGLADNGITETHNAFAVKHVKAFYSAAGEGTQLYLMLLGAASTLEKMTDNSDATMARKLLDYAGGKIRVLAVMTDDSVVTVTTTDGINDKVQTAVTQLQEMADDYASNQMPFRGIVGATSYQGVPGDIPDLSTGTTNRVAVLLAQTDDTDDVCMGLLLAEVAVLPVQRKVSRVKNGALPVTQAYLGGETLETNPYDAAVIAGKGYITWQTYPQVAGYFFSPDVMTVPNTDDYAYLCRGRIIDKAQIIVYQTLVQEVDDEVPVDPQTGKLDPGKIASLQNAVEHQLEVTMGEKGEIVSATCYINPAQDILANSALAVSVGIVPEGYSSTINITLGYSNPALSA